MPGSGRNLREGACKIVCLEGGTWRACAKPSTLELSQLKPKSKRALGLLILLVLRSLDALMETYAVLMQHCVKQAEDHLPGRRSRRLLFSVQGL